MKIVDAGARLMDVLVLNSASRNALRNSGVPGFAPVAKARLAASRSTSQASKARRRTHRGPVRRLDIWPDIQRHFWSDRNRELIGHHHRPSGRNDPLDRGAAHMDEIGIDEDRRRAGTSPCYSRARARR